MVLSPQVALANTPVSCDVIRRRSPLSEDRLCTYLTNRSGLLLDTRTPLPKFSFFLTVIQYTVATCVGNSAARACRANHEGTFS